MSRIGVFELVGRAILSDDFRRQLLGSGRAECLRQLATTLDPDVQAAILSIQAAGLDEFGAAIQQLLEQRDGRAAGWPVVAPANAVLLHE